MKRLPVMGMHAAFTLLLFLVVSECAQARTLVGPIEGGRVTVRVSKIVIDNERFRQIAVKFARVPMRCDGGEVGSRSLDGGLQTNQLDDRRFGSYGQQHPPQWGYKGHLVGKSRAVGDFRIFDIDFSNRLQNCRTPVLHWTASQHRDSRTLPRRPK